MKYLQEANDIMLVVRTTVHPKQVLVTTTALARDLTASEPDKGSRFHGLSFPA